jgi:hypothetical protein
MRRLNPDCVTLRASAAHEKFMYCASARKSSIHLISTVGSDVTHDRDRNPAIAL